MSEEFVVEGNLVDVLQDRIYPARITVSCGRISLIEEVSKKFKNYILPGLIDSHVHVESSMLVPSRFAEIAVPKGVVAVIADPHEIGNVLGLRGIDFMIKDASSVPMKFRFMAPSCVPTTEFETSGAVIGPMEIDELLSRKDIYGLGEVMCYNKVISRDSTVMAKIALAKKYGKPIDGHAPGLTGSDLRAYLAAGITTDHESTTEAEAREKAEKGMIVQAREGSACSNIKALIPVMKDHKFFFSADDMHAGYCVEKGYVDRMLRMAVYYGIDPMKAIKAASIWPAEHYNLKGGAIYVGGPADMVFVSDIHNFIVKKVYIDGKLVAEDGKALFEVKPLKCDTHIVRYQMRPSTFYLHHDGDKVRVRVISVRNKQILSEEESHILRIKDGIVEPDARKDVLLFAVANRYVKSKPMVGFIKGFGLKECAIASSVSHDSHNLVAVATSYELLAKAINAVSSKGGHYVTDGIEEKKISLPVAGLMSTDPGTEVAAAEHDLIAFARRCGCKLNEPFMTMGFQCLLVIPKLKMSDKGLFDNTYFRLTSVFCDEERQ